MVTFTIIVTVGLVCSACMYDLNLFWFLGIALIAHIFVKIIKVSKDGMRDSKAMANFFSELEHSPESEKFSIEEVKEKFQEKGTLLIKSIYNSILNEIWDKEDEKTYCKNLRFILIEIRQEIAARQIEAHRYSKRKKKDNYARMYAHSLNFPLYQYELSDKEALQIVDQYSDAELSFVVLDTDGEILNTTSEHTCGREEEMESYYHNNLRRIQFLLRKELAKRYLES